MTKKILVKWLRQYTEPDWLQMQVYQKNKMMKFFIERDECFHLDNFLEYIGLNDRQQRIKNPQIKKVFEKIWENSLFENDRENQQLLMKVDRL